MAAGAGQSPEDIDAVWSMLREFAGYMFNKAHSAAYAVEAFAGAWLKTRYPSEFLAAVLSSRRGFYAPILYVLEALRCGAKFLTPDLHASDPARFLVRGTEIRLPLDQVRGLSSDTLIRITSGRPFADPGDFYRRVRPSRPEWMALLKAGALDGWNEPRGRLFWRMQRLEASSGVGAARGELSLEPSLPESWDAGGDARARWENEVLGFPVSVHPLDYFAPGVNWSCYISTAAMVREQQALFGKTVRACGLIVADRHHPTANGTMKFLTLADYTGFVEVSLFSRVYKEYGHITANPVVAVEAVVDPFDNRRGFALNGSRVMRP